MNKRIIYFLVIKKIITLIIISLFFSSCSGGYPLVGGSVDRESDMSSYKTYRTLELEQVELPHGMTADDYYTLIAAIDGEMSLRNYRKIPDSDLVIEIGLTSSTYFQEGEHYGLYTNAYYFGLPEFAPWRKGDYMYPYMTNYRSVKIADQGVLIIDFIDTKNQKHLYSAAVKSGIAAGENPLNSASEVVKMVTSLFKKFPVKISKQ